MKQVFVFASVCAGLLFGCADVHVAEYQRPGTASTWSRPPTVSATEAISPQWWAQFGDPYLDSLVAKALYKALGGGWAPVEVANAGR
jgi:outer membrane protein, multidrug efflux system